MGGVVPIGENYMEADFFTIWRKRVVWLSLLFLAELFTFTALEHFEDAIKAVTVLSLFVPLCLSTGGNSGSQAATLITRSLALRQISSRDWLKVLRHELLMGLVLGISLGGIGFVRASLTHEATLRNDEERKEPFEVHLKPGQEVKEATDRKFIIPANVLQLVGIIYRTESQITVPSGGQVETKSAPDGSTVVRFPGNCVFSTAQVQRFDLAWIVACAVAAICVLGTLVGSILPLVFKSLGLDPALASSPFVATFVDVSGIMIFFNVAVAWLPGLG
jgi:magnesium transporter